VSVAAFRGVSGSRAAVNCERSHAMVGGFVAQ